MVVRWLSGGWRSDGLVIGEPAILDRPTGICVINIEMFHFISYIFYFQLINIKYIDLHKMAHLVFILTQRWFWLSYLLRGINLNIR